MRLYYDGPALESGGTSIAGNVAPAIRRLFASLELTGTILDFGAGKYARNADWLRQQGAQVFAYDVFNCNTKTTVEGWQPEKVANSLPNLKFDIGFSCFVLNVVSKQTEKEIIQQMDKCCNQLFHVTRNLDIVASVEGALKKNEPIVTRFYQQHFLKDNPGLTMNDSVLLQFCKYGVQTKRGFQRLTDLTDLGYHQMIKTNGYIIWEKTNLSRVSS